jgi:hypothetical protein
LSSVSSSNAENAFLRSAQEQKDAYSEQLKRAKDAQEEERERAEKVSLEDLRSVQKESAEEIRRAREEASQRVVDDRKSARLEIEKLKNQLYDKGGKTSVKEARDYSDERNDLNRFRQELTSEFESRQKKADAFQKASMENSRQALSADSEKALAEQKRTLKGELSDANREIQQHRSVESRQEQAIADARSKTIQGVEGEFYKQIDNMQDALATETALQARKSQEKDETHKQRLHDVQLEGKTRMDNALRGQRAEFSDRERALVTENRLIADGADREILAAKERANRGQMTLVNKQEFQSQKAIEAQKKAFLKDADQAQGMMSEELKEQNRELQKLRQATDLKDVPSGARARIEAKVRDDYENKLSTVHEKNAAEREEILAAFAKERVDGRHNSEKERMAMRRELLGGREAEKIQFTTTYTDLAASKEAEVRRIQEVNRKQASRLEKSHAEELAVQTASVTEALAEHRYQSDSKNKQTLQESLLRERTLAREFNNNLNAARREHDNKMSEMIEDYEDRLKSAKLERDSAVRENDRKNRSMLEERVRAYEHQIKQIEATHKERERFLTEHYEDEAARMRRTNARLIQKKS